MFFYLFNYMSITISLQLWQRITLFDTIHDHEKYWNRYVVFGYINWYCYWHSNLPNPNDQKTNVLNEYTVMVERLAIYWEWNICVNLYQTDSVTYFLACESLISRRAFNKSSLCLAFNGGNPLFLGYCIVVSVKYRYRSCGDDRVRGLDTVCLSL